MRKRLLAAPVLLVLALVLTACGSDSSSNTEATTTVTEEAEGQSGAGSGGSGEASTGKLERAVTVDIENFAYHPDPVRVATGGKVIWKNMDSAPHTATADDGSFDTGTIEEGKLKSETFKEAGTFTYHCDIHPTMHGTVEVVDQE